MTTRLSRERAPARSITYIPRQPSSPGSRARRRDRNPARRDSQRRDLDGRPIVRQSRVTRCGRDALDARTLAPRQRRARRGRVRRLRQRDLGRQRRDREHQPRTQLRAGLRRRAAPRLRRRPRAPRRRRRHRERPGRATATGSSAPTAASSRSATPASSARPAATTLNAPIVGIAATPDGRGYWLVGADGGVFAFGDATLRRLDRRRAARRADRRASSPPSDGQRLLARRRRRRRLRVRQRPLPRLGRRACSSRARSSARPPRPRGHGYWLVGADGGVFAFGDAPLPRRATRSAATGGRHRRLAERATATGSRTPTAA